MAGPSEVKIVFTGNSTDAETKARRVRKEVEGIEKAGRSSGPSFDKVLKSFGGMLLSAEAIRRAISGAASAFNQFVDKQAAAQKQSGGVQLRAEIAGQRAGLAVGDVNAILGAAGSATQEARAAFLERGGKGKRDPEALRMAGIAFASGLVTEEEAFAGARSKEGAARLQKLADDRREKLSTLAKVEFGTRDIEQGLERIVGTERETVVAGAVERRRKAQREAEKLRSPYATMFSEWVGETIPGAETVIDAGDRVIGTGAEARRLTRELAGEVKQQKQVNYSASTDQGR